GDVSLLRQEPSGERQSFLFGWAARQPLAVGSRFTATLATEPAAVGDTSVGGQFALRVEGLSTVQAAPVATFHDWGRYWRGEPEGDSVQCALNQTSPPCGPPRTVSLPTRVREEVAAIVVWAPPDIVGGVAWNLRFEGAQVGADPGSDFFDRVEGFEPHADYGGDVGLFVAFPEPAERYCATMVIEDLRTGLEQRSELCAGPPLPLTAMFGSDTMLGSCAEPPTPELTQAWCELRQSTSPICSGDDAHLEPESSLVGCALSPAQPGPSALLSLAGLVSTWLVRRRGQRQSKKR
ncbi:MAG TPA: hypothetical protein VNN80_00505, partial [Polyangiaceae bacterium]|nr:hypothetical protein [Polyangiaceae bacterium]